MSDARIAALELKVELLELALKEVSGALDSQQKVNGNLVAGLESVLGCLKVLGDAQVDATVAAFKSQLDAADKCGKHCACGDH